MGQPTTRHPEYERGYHDGYQSGVNYALTGAIDVAMKSSQPSAVVTAPAEVVAAKRDLAEKVLAAIDETWRWDDARAAVLRVFTESGVAVETMEAKGGDAK